MKMRLMILAAATLALAVGVPVAPAQSFYDDFDGLGYIVGNPLPSPWITGSNGNAVEVTDYGTGGSTNYTAAFYFGDPNNYDWGASFRPISPWGGGVAYARIRRRPFGGAQLALTQTTENYRNGIQFNDDSVRIHFDDWRDTRNQAIAWVRVNGTNELKTADFNIQEDQWYDVRITYSADRRDFTFEYKRDTQTVWTLGLQHTASEELNLNYVGLGVAVYSSGNAAQWVGYDVVPEETSFTNLVVQDTPALEFLSSVGQPYRLEYTTDLVSSSFWDSAGANLTGTGANMYFFDPNEASGSSTSKAYRIVTP